MVEGTSLAADWQLLVLAGGKGSRLGGIDKGLMLINGQPAVLHLQTRLSPSSMLVSANRHADRYAEIGVTTVADRRPEFCGPLAGVEAMLLECKSRQAVVVPCDMPLLPPSLPAELLSHLEGEESIVVVHDGERLQPLCMALTPAIWRDDLSDYLDQGGRSVQGWLEGKPVKVCRLSSGEAFANVNTDEDLAAYQ